MANEAAGCVGEWDIGLANDDSYSEEGEGCRRQEGYREYGVVGEWRWYLGAEGPCPPRLPTWARETGTTPPLTSTLLQNRD